jgi:alkyl hydroperoxide reductase subunit AhpF
MLLDDDVKADLRKAFEGLRAPVRLAVFSQTLADPASAEVARLVQDLADLDPRLRCESYNFVLDAEKVAELGVARIPAIAVLGAEQDHGIRFYGRPDGYEFATLVDAVLDVSHGESRLAPETVAALAALERPVHLQVFSTPG